MKNAAMKSISGQTVKREKEYLSMIIDDRLQDPQHSFAAAISAKLGLARSRNQNNPIQT
jgi:hypothetical protein